MYDTARGERTCVQNKERSNQKAKSKQIDDGVYFGDEDEDLSCDESPSDMPNVSNIKPRIQSFNVTEEGTYQHNSDNIEQAV